MYILLTQTYCLFPSYLQRNGTNTLGLKSSRQHTAKSVGCVRHQNDFFFFALFCKFYRIRVLQFMDLLIFLLLFAHGDGFHKRTDPNAQGTLDVAFIHFQYQRNFSRYFFHHSDDFVRQIRIMSAAETDQLHIFQMFTFRCQNRRGKHTCMIIIYHIQTAMA